MQIRSTSPACHAAFGGLGVPRILLAAENVAVRLTLTTVLERCGFMVETASSADDAEAKIEQGTYDMVLCDLKSQPMATRRRVLETARAQEYQPATALIEVNPDGGHEAGSDELLIEPVDIPQLMTQITELMANRAYGRSVRNTRETAA